MRLKTSSLIRVFIGFLSILMFQCTTINIGKLAPEYKGVNSKIQPYLDEFKELAKIQGITFKNEVTAGFKKINDGNTIGLCNYGENWREIDVDQEWWESSTSLSKFSLVLHEADHCYCHRAHTFRGGKYPEAEEWRNQNPRVGIYEDGCSLSLMAPIIQSDDCMLLHYNDYIKELFENCSAW